MAPASPLPTAPSGSQSAAEACPPGRSRLATALSVLHQKDIEILKGVMQVNSALLTGTPDLAAIRRTLQRGDLIEDLTVEIQDVATGLKDGRGRQLRRISV